MDTESFWTEIRDEAIRAAFLWTGRASLAQEAVQEAWAAFLSNPPAASPRGWFFGILRNKARRLRSSRSTLSLDAPLPGAEGLTLGESLPDRGEGPEAEARKKEEIASLLEALQALDEPLQEAVSLRWILGWSDADMAEALGVSPEAARQRAHRGLEALEEALNRKNRVTGGAPPGG